MTARVLLMRFRFMHVHRWLLSLAFATVLVMPSCTMIQLHRPSLQQGNLVNQKMVNKLEPCMTKEQVEFVMGRPVVRNTFNVDRWDYVYTFESRDGERERKAVSLRFKDGALTSIEGNYLPENTDIDFATMEKCDPVLASVEETEQLIDELAIQSDPFAPIVLDDESGDDPFSSPTVLEDEEAAVQDDALGSDEAIEQPVQESGDEVDPLAPLVLDDDEFDDPFSSPTVFEDEETESTVDESNTESNTD